jgi:membrane associated rhomboid family serine protease
MNRPKNLQYYWNVNNSAITRLIVFNVVFTVFVWLFAKATGSEYAFTLPANLKLLIYRPYTLVTYMFSHAGFMHLLSNMIVLYFIGREFENLFGNYKTYKAYLISGFVAALVFVIIYNIPGINLNPIENDVRAANTSTFLVGASGSVMGILFGLTVIRPNIEFYLYGLVKLKLWWITIAYAFMDFMGLMSLSNTGGRIAHLAGGITGALLLLYWDGIITIPKPLVNRKKTVLTVTKKHDIRHKIYANTSPSQKEIDEILDKINESGYDSLSKSEKDLLFRAKEN